MMEDRIAIILPNYNMPERTDALGDYIRSHVEWPHDLIVVDNGSDLAPPSRYTTISLRWNVQTTHGWLAGLHYSDSIAMVRGKPYFAYWLLITSAAPPEAPPAGCPITPLARLLLEDPGAAGVHHALTPDSTTSWEHLKDRGTNGPRRTWMLDNISVLWRAEFFNRAGRLDPHLTMGWGVDLEICYMARIQSRSLWVYDGACMRKDTDIGYAMRRMNMTADERRQLASRQMEAVLSRRYGPDWRNYFFDGDVHDDWR